jgi:putative ABC transport system permease protein
VGFFETILNALRDLRLRKFRSGLATLGIIFAVASVMAMISISDGARRQALDQITKLGLDNIIVRSVKPVKNETQSSSDQRGDQQWVLKYGLKRRDVDHIRETYPMIRRVVPVKALRFPVFVSGIPQQTELSILATNAEYMPATRTRLVQGRFLTPVDETSRERVCVLGTKAARKVFAYNAPMGADVRVSDVWYRVVGIVENEAELKDAGGDDINNSVFIPMSTAYMQHGDITRNYQSGSFETSEVELHSLIVQVTDDNAVLSTAKRLESYFTQGREKKDWQLTVPLQLMKQKAQTQSIFTIVMASIAGISLVIGGIGVMNIMLANVTERRKEIGTRRALGASRRDVILQFLCESAVLTTLGGLVGLGLGWVLADAVSRFADWPTYISPWTVALSLSVSSISGLFFGLWPAHVASQVNPIEALRAD